MTDILVLYYRLMKSGINPFDSQEAKPYKNDPEILAMTNLVMAYQNNDINEFENILKQNRKNIMDDPFIREHIEGEVVKRNFNSVMPKRQTFLMSVILFEVFMILPLGLRFTFAS